MPENLAINLYLDEDEDDSLPIPPPLGDDEEIKLEPEETIPERVKLNLWKITGTGLKILTPNKLLIRLPILLVQKKSWKQFIQIKKRNQTNTISFVSA